ncbi:MAG: tetratricopeptide repeat protein [Syntrophaceae bacterium]
MVNLTEQKQKANQLRKAEKFEEALQLYRSLWESEGDKFDGAGLLHCLRKLWLFDEAIILSKELIDKYLDFDWCRNEVIWTLISGRLNKLEEDAPLEKVLTVAKEIMDLNPDAVAKKTVVFKVLKSAKSSNQWVIVNEWVVNIDPTSLSTEPITDESGKGGWSDQALWYNYRINGLIKQDNPKEAIVVIDEILEHFPKQRKFFLRLKALSYYHLGNLPESEKLYQDLCNRYKPDWWLLHEYAIVVRDAGRSDEALKIMYQAARSNPKLESTVSLFADIGMLCKKMEQYENAIAHLVLCKHTRNEKGWNVPESITSTINELDNIIGNDVKPSSLKEALKLCRTKWTEVLGEEDTIKAATREKRTVRKGLIGKVNLGRSDKSFCFINSDKEQSFFCHKSDLPSDIIDGSDVIFDAIPSFDKKKNKESWKAVNLRPVQKNK